MKHNNYSTESAVPRIKIGSSPNYVDAPMFEEELKITEEQPMRQVKTEPQPLRLNNRVANVPYEFQTTGTELFIKSPVKAKKMQSAFITPGLPS